MNRLLYTLIYVPTFLLALLPFRILFLISDFFYFILFYLIRYRKKLVQMNLQNAFPDKNPNEIRKIEKDFYRYFCDCFFETIKLLHISDSEMKKHIAFNNKEPLQNVLDKKQPVVLLLGHYGNWEWIPSLALHMRLDEDTVFGQIYRPLKNKSFDSFFLHIRKRFRTVNLTKYNVYRDIVSIMKANKNWILGFMSDQKPSGNQVPHLMRFLNQETPILTGTEKIAQHTGAAVCYLDITSIKRGYYEVDMPIIFDNAAETSEFEITEKYIRFLEQTIRRNPACYLWTHNRWRIKV